MWDQNDGTGGTPQFLPIRYLRGAAAAALLFLAAAIPVDAQDTPASAKPSPGTERRTVEFEGTRIVFPEGEADVVEQLKPAIRKFREERRRVVEAEAQDIANAFSGTEAREKVRRLVAVYTARESVSERFNARWAAQSATMQELATAWREWSSDISELQLWRDFELAPFKTRADGSDDAEGFSHRFPQVSFGKNGGHFTLNPPYAVPLLGLDIMLKFTKVTKPMRLDLPLFYKPGETPEQIAKYGASFIGELPAMLHKEYSSKTGMVASLPPWTIENMLLGEMEAAFVDPRTAKETALADGLARFLLFVEMLKQEGEQQMAQKFGSLFPFGIGGWDLSDHTAILSTLEKLDPLGKVERSQVTERIFARNLIALTLVEIAQKDDTKAPILHKFKKAGVAVPSKGFNVESFIGAVDKAYGEVGFFQRALAAKKATTLEQLRQSIAQQKEAKKETETVAEIAPVAPTPVPGRQSAKFDGLEITFPPELKAAVEIVGPEYAKVLAKARKEFEALSRKKPAPIDVDLAKMDLTAFRSYGLEPDAGLLHDFAVMLGAMQDGTQFARWFVSGDRMQIWIKEDMIAFLKGGGSIPDFTLAPGGERVTWNVSFQLLSSMLDTKKLGSSAANAYAEISKRLDTIPHPVYPIVLKREVLPGTLDDPVAVAAAIRAGEREILGSMRTAEENPEKASEILGSVTPKFGHEQGWFLVAHEVAENAVVKDVIRSADRRWFCDGMANWIAIQEVDRRFGPGKGAEAFAKSFNADEQRKHASKVNLLAWPDAEDVNSGSRPNVEYEAAYYYYATLVFEKACEGRGAGFVKKWLAEIRKTPVNRANGGTVVAAYQKLTGKDLKAIMGEVVK